ncbi:MAG: trypsin-like peptidase domain-containing protein [Planctomycetes bacterium]|nr:trypsin-like peptidase domain-containing protein [Planctomycetota bacterium]
MNRQFASSLALVFLAGITLGASLYKLFGQTSEARDPEKERAAAYEGLARLEGSFKSFPAVAAVVSESVVHITAVSAESTDEWVLRDPNIATGSGFIINAAGDIVTNNHVIQGASQVRVALPGGQEVLADVVGTDPETDIALLHVEVEGLKPLLMGNSDEVIVGEWVMAVGSPYGLTNTVTTGIVSAKGRSGVGSLAYQGFIQTDAAVNPGNSGGPLVNLRGEVIGVTSSILSKSGGYDGISFAIPINRAKFVAAQLRKTGTVVRGYIGAYFADMNQDLVTWVNSSTTLRARDVDDLRRKLRLGDARGVFVLGVAQDGPAARAGLRLGDLLTEFNGQPVTTQPELKERIAALAPGQKVELTVLRNGKSLAASLEVQQRPRMR